MPSLQGLVTPPTSCHRSHKHPPPPQSPQHPMLRGLSDLQTPEPRHLGVPPWAPPGVLPSPAQQDPPQQSQIGGSCHGTPGSNQPSSLSCHILSARSRRWAGPGMEQKQKQKRTTAQGREHSLRAEGSSPPAVLREARGPLHTLNTLLHSLTPVFSHICTHTLTYTHS